MKVAAQSIDVNGKSFLELLGPDVNLSVYEIYTSLYKYVHVFFIHKVLQMNKISENVLKGRFPLQFLCLREPRDLRPVYTCKV